MKPYKWSNGETVTAQDVVFWMNMLKVEKLNWAGYAAGTIPDDVAVGHGERQHAHVHAEHGRANPNWFTYNELSQITPMPMAWDITHDRPEAGSRPAARRPTQR